NWVGERAFCNPPFGRIAPIVAKARKAAATAFLLPVTALTTRYFGEHVPNAIAIPPYRVKFIPPEGLNVRTVSPSSGTVLLCYGDADWDQIRRIGFVVAEL